ncbi:tetratricopeptide repeat protein [Trichocoleus sp. FACHB-591]|uniref:tetratricopeptide repeat protein n=1 Tax=Trichocoleus sp. FACHB-591 TaxID=2692872 RepID=UPI001682ECFA|nr:tetratricopeptide repeat protein [Trichocoleus sp. FACHB-591]MBD2096647.1 tetratricopeptide repeat protein [Trichocoleus sp. FACHB-591]
MATIREAFVSAVQHHEAGQLHQAEQLYRLILQQEANYFPALHGLGLIAYQAGYIEESIAHYRQAIALKPEVADAYNNLGLALVANGEYAAAVASYQQAIALNPRYPEAYNNLGHALRHQGKVAKAIAAYDQSIVLKPEFVSPHWNRSLALLLGGNLGQGFAEYEWRWRREGKQLRPFPQPLWDGSNLAGRWILLYAEQGFGDTMQFIRYATWVAEHGGQVVVECQAPLVRLVQTVPGVQAVVAQGEALPAFEVQRPLMSLPWLHGTTLETVPAQVPYLQVPSSSSITLVTPPNTQLKVGFVWSGNPENRNNRNRSCTAGDFRPLLDIPGVTLYSLQKAAQPEELAQLGALSDRLQDLSPQLQDFGDTAAAIAQLDLVVTVDTAVAHLAGALGKPVWVLLSFAPDWRWMLEREDTPWYPTMRLFRQAQFGDWAGVLTRVVAALREAIAQPQKYLLDKSQTSFPAPLLQERGAAGGERSANALPEQDWAALLKTAIQHYQSGRLVKAEQLYQQILQAQPNQAEVWQLRGALAATEKRNSDAIAYYQKALALKPNFPEAHSNLGVALSQTGQIEAAIFHYRQAIALNPGAAELHHNLGAALKEQGQVDAAIAHYQQAIALNPNYAMTYNNLGTIWEAQGRYVEAMACYKQALAVNPENVDARFSRAIALLRLGDLRQGFEEYEWRWRRLDMKPQPFKQPIWDGSDLSGKTLLIHTEQGFGDTIQFIRYVGLVAQKGGRILVACQQALSTLIQPLPQIQQFIVEGQAIPKFDVHAPLLSLPRILDTSLENIPAQVPYLQPPTSSLTLVAPPATQLKVGLVWSGNPSHPHNQQRSCPLQQFLPLLELPGVAFYSLQKGPQIADLAQLPSTAIQDLSPQLQDFGDTAAAIAQLDLVIAIDTSVAHLAGALGKPVWLLLDTSPDWRWLTDREDSPWYPTMRLFRQTTAGNWPEVIERVSQALQKLLASCLPTPLSDLEAAIATALQRHQTNQLEAASTIYFQVLQQDPNHLDALHLLGVIAHQKRQFDQAIAYYKRVLTIAPNFAEAHANLSATLREQGQFAEAIVHCQKALAFNPNFTNAYASLGLIYRQQGQVAQAIAAYNQALASNPDDIETHWNRALAWLIGGDFQQGLAEYEWRWRRPHRRPRPFTQPLWDGSDLQGQTILLHAEQGFGDTIQFIRYAALVAERGGRVIVECQAPLLRLLAGVAGIDQLVAQETPLPAFDLHTPLLSLPRLFGTTVDTIPASVPYIFPPTQSAVKLSAPTGHLKVGIVWSGSRTNQNNHHRSCSPHYFQPLLAIPGVSFYSLQKDASVAELAQLTSDGATVENLSSQLQDFADTAAAIAQLDLVITVDTSVAHLAGAMGKPVWVLLTFAPDWRWLLEREDSPWYPTMRLFRQQQPGGWAAVINRVQEALQTLVETPSPSTHSLPAMPQPSPEFAAATPPDDSTNVTPPPPTANTKPVRPIGIGWQLSLMTGWGVYGINFTLQLQQHPHFAPMLLTPASVTSELLNPLHQVLLRPAIAQQQNLQNLLANYPNQQVGLDIPIFYALGKDFDSKLLPRVFGQRNFGVVFFEDTALKPEAIAKAKTYDAIVAGSTWNAQVLQSYGLENVYTAPQGIDPAIFHPAPKANLFRDRFVIFSGGKLEYRKGQDIVIAAFRAFRDRHPEALLLTAWHNFWPQFMLGLEQSGHVQGMPAIHADGRLRVVEWLVANGIPADACIDVGPIPNHMVGQIIREAHVALFPNRAEGGTNLVAMESMACGLPTILSANTGHLDLIGSDRCYALTHQKPAKSIPIFQGVEGWGESNVEEIIEALEQVYTDYQTAQAKGQAAAHFMQDWTWEKQVQRCLTGLNL